VTPNKMKPVKGRFEVQRNGNQLSFFLKLFGAFYNLFGITAILYREHFM